MNSNNDTLEDLVDEGARIAAHAFAANLQLRLAGGVAIALRCPSARAAPLARQYADVDFAGRSKDKDAIIALLRELGYEPDEQFNALNGRRRLLLWHSEQRRHIDIFLDQIEMCHTFDIAGRLGVDQHTLPLADLLMLKLQIVETNDKDILDILALLVDQTFTADDSGMNLPYIVERTSADWGLWKTLTTVAMRTQHFAQKMPGFEHAVLVNSQVTHFVSSLESSSKTRAWRLRAKVGERKRWYELPEEAH